MKVIVNNTGDVIKVSASASGSPGPPGPRGNGIESITLIGAVGLVNTYQILFTDGTTFNYDVTDGTDGTDGVSAYVYIAYASDASGTDFTNTFDPLLDYIAILSTDTEINTPVASDFTGLWKNYTGEGNQVTWDSLIDKKNKFYFFTHFGLDDKPVPTRSANGANIFYMTGDYGTGSSKSFGIIDFRTGGNTNGYAQIINTPVGPSTLIELGRIKCSLEARSFIPLLGDVTNDFDIAVGLENNNFAEANRDKIIFKYNYNENGGRFQCVTKNSGIETITDTGVLVTSETWYLMRIEIGFDSSVNFYINDVLVGTPTTNIPTNTGVTAGIIKKTGNTERKFYMDWIELKAEFLQTITTP